MNLDVTDAVKEAKKAVTDKSPLQALIALTSLYEPPSIASLEEEVRLKLGDSPFQALVPQSYLGPRGAVLAHHAGVLNPDDDTALLLETMRIAHDQQSSIGFSYLHAAAEQIRFEHGLDTQFFLQMCRASPFVPWGREQTFARALAAGIRGDYELAAIALCPQLEHAVRELFFASGLVTTTYPTSGVQNEYDLNVLLKDPGAHDIFGEKRTFDLRVLLIEKAGGNLRNDLAHGLLADNAKFGAKVYLWWVSLFLVLRPLLRRPRSTAESEVETNPES